MPEAPTFDELIRRVRGGRPGGRGRAGPALRAGDPPRRPLPPGRRAAGRPARLDGHLPVGPAELLRPRRLGPVRPGDARAAADAAGDDGPQQAGLAGPAPARRPPRPAPRRRPRAGRGGRLVAPGPGPERGGRGPRPAAGGPPPALARRAAGSWSCGTRGTTGPRSPRSSAARPRPCARSSPAPSTGSPRSWAWTTRHDRPARPRILARRRARGPGPTGPCWRSCWRTSGAAWRRGERPPGRGLPAAASPPWAPTPRRSST